MRPLPYRGMVRDPDGELVEVEVFERGESGRVQVIHIPFPDDHPEPGWMNEREIEFTPSLPYFGLLLLSTGSKVRVEVVKRPLFYYPGLDVYVVVAKVASGSEDRPLVTLVPERCIEPEVPDPMIAPRRTAYLPDWDERIAPVAPASCAPVPGAKRRKTPYEGVLPTDEYGSRPVFVLERCGDSGEVRVSYSPPPEGYEDCWEVNEEEVQFLPDLPYPGVLRTSQSDWEIVSVVERPRLYDPWLGVFVIVSWSSAPSEDEPIASVVEESSILAKART